MDIEDAPWDLDNMSTDKANALKNIVIPKFQANARYIADSLEEKEREEFSRMKVIKLHKTKSDNGSVN